MASKHKMLLLSNNQKKCKLKQWDILSSRKQIIKRNDNSLEHGFEKKGGSHLLLVRE